MRHFEIRIRVAYDECPDNFEHELKENVEENISDILDDATKETIVDSWCVNVDEVRR